MSFGAYVILGIALGLLACWNQAKQDKKRKDRREKLQTKTHQRIAQSQRDRDDRYTTEQRHDESI